MEGTIIAVCRSETHTFRKPAQPKIRLVEGFGVEGDAHAGTTVQHLSRIARDPSVPNLRQVHLIHSELYDELRGCGFEIHPGQLGENIATRGIDLLGLSTGSLLYLGETAVIEVTGLRNPCAQLEKVQPGLMAAVLDRDEHGGLIRKSGIMAIVRTGGEIQAGDSIRLSLPADAHRPLECV